MYPTSILSALIHILCLNFLFNIFWKQYQELNSVLTLLFFLLMPKEDCWFEELHQDSDLRLFKKIPTYSCNICMIQNNPQSLCVCLSIRKIVKITFFILLCCLFLEWLYSSYCKEVSGEVVRASLQWIIATQNTNKMLPSGLLWGFVTAILKTGIEQVNALGFLDLRSHSETQSLKWHDVILEYSSKSILLKKKSPLLIFFMTDFVV